jgi:hypothetical protein
VDEPFLSVDVPGQFGREKLQRNGAFKAGVFGFIDHPHPPAANVLEDLIVRNRLTDEAYHDRFSSRGAEGCLVQTSRSSWWALQRGNWIRVQGGAGNRERHP